VRPRSRFLSQQRSRQPAQMSRMPGAYQEQAPRARLPWTTTARQEQPHYQSISADAGYTDVLIRI